MRGILLPDSAITLDPSPFVTSGIILGYVSINAAIELSEFAGIYSSCIHGNDNMKVTLLRGQLRTGKQKFPTNWVACTGTLDGAPYMCSEGCHVTQIAPYV